MKSRIVQAGAAAGLGLGVSLVVGVLVDASWLTAVAAAGLGVVVCVAVADTNRRVRRLEKAVASGGGGLDVTAGPEVTEADVLGTVRLLQAQYTGRLDRLQQAVEALAHPPTAEPRSGAPSAS